MKRIKHSDIYYSPNACVNFDYVKRIDNELTITYAEDVYIDTAANSHIIRIKNKYDEIIGYSPQNNFILGQKIISKHSPVVSINEPYIFGGLVIPHYGHFITETLARFSLYDKFSFKFALFIKGYRHCPQPFIDFLNDCNIEYDIFDIAKNNFFFKQIFIPSPGITMEGLANCTHKNIANMVNTETLPVKKILYISKKKYLLQQTVNTANTFIGYNIEQKIEDLLISRYGAHIMYPDELSIKDQINTINEHEIIIGPQGSNMLTILLAKESKKVIQIMTDKTRYVGLSVAIDFLKNNKSFYIMDSEIDEEFEKILDFLIGEKNIPDYNRWKLWKNQCINNPFR